MSNVVAGVATGEARKGPKSILIGNPAIQIFRKALVKNTSATDGIEILEGLVVSRVSGETYKPLTVAEIPVTNADPEGAVPDALSAALAVVVDKRVVVPVQDEAGPGTQTIICAVGGELDRSMIRFTGGETWEALTDAQKTAIDDALRLWGLNLTERQELEI
jgi:hypothetical protein